MADRPASVPYLGHCKKWNNFLFFFYLFIFLFSYSFSAFSVTLHQLPEIYAATMFQPVRHAPEKPAFSVENLGRFRPGMVSLFEFGVTPVHSSSVVSDGISQVSGVKVSAAVGDFPSVLVGPGVRAAPIGSVVPILNGV